MEQAVNDYNKQLAVTEFIATQEFIDTYNSCTDDGIYKGTRGICNLCAAYIEDVVAETALLQLDDGPATSLNTELVSQFSQIAEIDGTNANVLTEAKKFIANDAQALIDQGTVAV